MHSQEDEQTQFDLAGRAGELKPENDEAQWPRIDPGPVYAEGWAKGYAEGWKAAIEALRSMNLHDAAEQLEAHRKRALARA